MTLQIKLGGAESDSFITVDEADTYLEGLPDDTTQWEELSTGEKELRLQFASQLMGHLPLKGRTVFRGQRLPFPRTCQPYNRRFQIPDDVKKSQAYLAYSVIHRGLTAAPPIDSGITSTFGSPSQISLAGLVSVSFGTAKGGTVLENLVSSLPFPVYMMMKKFISQVRGGSVLNADEARTLSTTTTSTAPPVVTTTTTV